MAEVSTSQSLPSVSAKTWFVPRARGQQTAFARLLERPRRQGRAAHEHVGDPDAVVRGVHGVAHVADAVAVHAQHEQVGRAGQSHDPGPVRPGEVEEHVVDGVDGVPVHVVTHHVPPAHGDGDGGAVVAGPHRARSGRRGARLLLGRELLAAVQHQQPGERHPRPFGQPLELLDEVRRPEPGLPLVGPGLTLGVAEREPPSRHRREVLAEEVHGRVHGLTRGLADRAT